MQIVTQDTITMGVMNPWGPLNPPQQSTYVAAIILANVFQSLIEFDPQGNLKPQLAVAWEVSPDLRIYKFRIDTSRRFSNGETLNSFILKKAFENSLRVIPASSNKSALDLLYKIEGYDKFLEKEELTGIKTPTPETLILEFSSPFRQALAFLAGVRYAVYLKIDGKYIGTGPYEIESSNDSEIFLRTNIYAKELPAFKKAKIIKFDPLHWDQELCNENIDVFWLTRPYKLAKCTQQKSPQFIKESGGVTTHLSLNVNGRGGRILSDPQLRRAVQYIIHRKATPSLSSLYDIERVTLDSQFLMPFQPGRLAAREVDALIDEGAKWVPKLIEASKQQPLYVWSLEEDDLIIIQALRNAGVSVITNNKKPTIDQFLNAYYKTFDYDLLLWTAGMGGLDPDALYHYLGEFGAISSPPIGREQVWQALEEGRQVLSSEHLHEVYEKVSRTILTEVPAIHLAFYRAGFLYFNKVKSNYRSVNSYRFNLSHFVPLT